MSLNISPETATEITSLPFNDTSLNIEDNPQDVSHLATCDAGNWGQAWYKYTVPVSGQILISLLANSSEAVYTPQLSIWTGTPGSLTQYILGHFGEQPFCGVHDNDFWWEIPVQPGETYYFRFVNPIDSFNPDTTLTVSVVDQPRGAAPAKSLVINDDTTGFPAVIFSTVDGAIYQIRPFPAGELTAILPTGEILTDYDESRTPAWVSPDWLTVIQIDTVIIDNIQASDNNFYILKSASAPRYIRKVLSDGTLSTQYNASGMASTTDWLAVTRDDTIAFYSTGLASGNVKAWDLVNNVALPDLFVIPAGRAWNTRDGGCLVNGTMWFHDNDSFSLNDHRIKGYNSSGVQQFDYSGYTSGSEKINRMCYYPGDGTAGDPESWWLWIFLTGVDANFFRFTRVKCSDGSVIHTFVSPISEMTNSGEPQEIDSPFAISNSCPIFITSTPLDAIEPPEPPPATGQSITVIKIVNPTSDQIFDFIATGMSPTNFQLSDGQSILFSGLPVGSGYSVLETAVPGYTTVYNVSNGDPVENISLAADENVIVTVTNTAVTSGGIYQIVPGKRNDTLWTDIIANETQDVKIPNPKFRTALVGK